MGDGGRTCELDGLPCQHVPILSILCRGLMYLIVASIPAYYRQRQSFVGPQSPALTSLYHNSHTTAISETFLCQAHISVFDNLYYISKYLMCTKNVHLLSLPLSEKFRLVTGETKIYFLTYFSPNEMMTTESDDKCF